MFARVNPESKIENPKYEALPDSIAEAIKRAGMAGPALVLLQTLKPLAWLGGQGVWALQPFIEGLGINRRIPISTSELGELLEDEGSVERLIERLRTPGEPGSR